MSYILDALRKAEAERERGNVPSVHAQPMFPSSASQTRASRRPPAWMVPASVAVLLLGAAGVWWGVARSGGGAETAPLRSASVAAASPTLTAPFAAAPPVAAAPQLQPQPQPQPGVATAVVPPPVNPPRGPLTAPPPAQQMAPVSPMTQTAQVSPVRTARPAPAPTRSLESILAALPKPPAEPASAPNSPGAPTQAGAPESRVVALHDLPADIRRQLPPFAVGGAMYSPIPANRLLIVNGQVLHEGDHVTPELTLLQIKVKAAVLEFRGVRYSVDF